MAMVQNWSCSRPMAITVHSSQSISRAARRLPTPATDPGPSSGRRIRLPGYQSFSSSPGSLWPDSQDPAHRRSLTDSRYPADGRGATGGDGPFGILVLDSHRRNTGETSGTRGGNDISLAWPAGRQASRAARSAGRLAEQAAQAAAVSRGARRVTSGVEVLLLIESQ